MFCRASCLAVTLSMKILEKNSSATFWNTTLRTPITRKTSSWSLRFAHALLIICLFCSEPMIATARICEELVQIGEAPELSAMRSIWDDLLKATCCEPTEALSKCFLFVIQLCSVSRRMLWHSSSYSVEKSIPLPRNKAAQLGPGFPRSG